MEKTAFRTCLPMLDSRRMQYTRYLFWSLAPLAAASGLLYAFFGAPVLAAGMHYQVFAENLEEVSALAFDRNGDLYATLEKRHGRGQLVHIQGGQTRVLLDNLDKP